MSETAHDAPWTTRLAGWSAVAVAVAFAVFWLPTPIVFDEYLALPIARAVGTPRLYGTHDLLINAGLRGPYHLYRAAGALYAAGMDVDAWWYAGLIVTLAAFAAAVWFLTGAFTRHAATRAFVTVLIGVSPFYRGTINWSGQPLLTFITASVAVPLAVASLACALRGRHLAALLLGALAFDVHPGAGIIALAPAVAILLTARADDAHAPVPWPRRLGWLAAAGLVALPNAAYILLSLPGNFHGAGVGTSGTAIATAGAAVAAQTHTDGPTFFEIFRLFAYHVFPRDHWREGYVWFVLELIAGVYALRWCAPAIRRRAATAISALVGLLALYALAVSVIHVPWLLLVFLGRASWLLKPLCFALVGAAWTQAWAHIAQQHDVDTPFATRSDAALTRAQRLRIGLVMAAILFVAAVLHRNVRVAEGFLALGLGVFVVTTLAMPSATAASAAPTALCPKRWPLAAALGIPVVLSILSMSRSPAAWMPRSPATITRALHFSHPDSSMRPLTTWAATTPPGTLFLVPPDDRRFVPFRLQAGRGVYIMTADIPQLAYDVAVYREGYQRLLNTGLVILGPHQFDAHGYDTLSADRLSAFAAEGARFAIFARDARTMNTPFPVAFRDDQWIVYDLTARVASQGTGVSERTQ